MLQLPNPKCGKIGQCFFWFKRRRSDGTNDGTVKNILTIIVYFQYLIRKVRRTPHPPLPHSQKIILI